MASHKRLGRLRPASVCHLHFDSRVAARDERTCTVKKRYLVLLEQVQDAIVVLLDDGVLARKQAREIEAYRAQFDAVIGEVMARVLVIFRRLQQRLRRDAADVGASAAKRGCALGILPLVDAGYRQAELRRADGGNISAGARTDDDD